MCKVALSARTAQERRGGFCRSVSSRRGLRRMHHSQFGFFPLAHDFSFPHHHLLLLLLPEGRFSRKSCCFCCCRRRRRSFLRSWKTAAPRGAGNARQEAAATKQVLPPSPPSPLHSPFSFPFFQSPSFFSHKKKSPPSSSEKKSLGKWL